VTEAKENKTLHKFIHLLPRAYIFIAIWRIHFSPTTSWNILDFISTCEQTLCLHG